MAPSLTPAPTVDVDGRLSALDATRPMSQMLVITTHALIFFAPLATSLAVGNVLFLTRCSREVFFFLSALVLTLNYADAARFPWGHYLRRRLWLSGVPYVVWTVIYYVYTTARPVPAPLLYEPRWGYLVSGTGLRDLLSLFDSGYYQLYFLVALFQFYVVFPFVLQALRRCRRWHVAVLLGAFAWQILYDESLRHHLIPFSIGGKLETRLILSYPIYLLGGMIAALNFRVFHEWVLRRRAIIIVSAVALAVLALVLNGADLGSFVNVYVTPHMDVQAPLAVLYNLAAILVIYLVGVALTSSRRSPLARALVASCAASSYGIYLSQMIWIPALVRLATHLHVDERVDWPLRVILVVAIVFTAGYVFSLALRHTPLGPYVVGRRARTTHRAHLDVSLE